MKAAVAVAAAALTVGALAANVPNRIEARATSTASTSLPTVTVKGNAFFNGSDRFYIRGVDYQPGGSSSTTDPLADYSTCSRDIPYFQKLGLNTIRVYAVDNSVNHDACMNALAEAGIYLVLDVNNPKYSLNRDNPAESYNPTYLQSVFATIDAFAGYTNTLVFFSGNEVINSANSTAAAPYVKAVTRDMKQYIGERGYRQIPVGYSAADVSQNQYLLAQYLDCGTDTNALSDFYAINNYEWCDPSSYVESGWSALVQQYSNYSLPLFMSEYGCITNTRKFQETSALYQPDMTSVFSGGLVYEYSQEGNGYGIVTINGNTVTPVGNQFTWLQEALANTSDPTNGGGYRENSGSTQPCPAQSSNWDTSPFTGDALPAMPSGAEQYMKNGAGAGPGLNGVGSQDAAGGSSSTASANAGAVTATYGSGSPSSTGSSSSSSSSSSAASPLALGRMDLAPFACVAVTILSAAFGAALL
ncbi:glycoside hydrolase family 72 protein [Acidomyces richmondensis BFW]|nr:MAG: glycoside hydrolase family 72 protein [Acidomyces sp. 'richmondensis']KYG48566.1 glycoside hydrolase family 72 protein [Acidomyces richmondensis BFW]